MPFYHNLNASTPQGKRTIERLLVLRKQLSAEIPDKQLERNLLLATWNIREFGTPKYGGRTDEALFYIAEIIARFDIIAVQEVRKDLSTLIKLMGILGDHWEYMFTDVTEGREGNQERLTFIFDSRKVQFGGLAGEMVLPPLKRTDKTTGQAIYVPNKQLARTPYMCGFKAGWTNFALTTVHILYGSSAANDPQRINEIKEIANAMAQRADDKFEWSNNIVLLGDFNIFSKKDSTIKAITSAGFTIPKDIQSLPGSNALKNKFYDQIAFKVKPNRFDTTGKAGIFDYYQSVFRDEDEKLYASEMGNDYTTSSNGQPRKDKSVYYKTYWRTFQMSDHLPMWVEICIDHTEAYLKARMVPPQKEDQAVAQGPKQLARKK